MAISQAILVESIIKAYLKFQEPIGSETLRLFLDVKVSSATIRYHFKELVEAGLLKQLHTSGGRIPTDFALKQYWRSRLNPLARPNFSGLEHIKKEAKKAGVFCGLRFYCPNFFEEIMTVNKRFMVLRFTRGELVLEYSEVLERFLKGILGLEANEILRISHQLSIPQLAWRIRSLENESPSFICGLSELASLIKESKDEVLFEQLIQGIALEAYNEGLYFEKFVPKGGLAFIQNGKIDNRDIRFICVGAINKDYEEFYRQISV